MFALTCYFFTSVSPGRSPPKNYNTALGTGTIYPRRDPPRVSMVALPRESFFDHPPEPEIPSPACSVPFSRTILTASSSFLVPNTVSIVCFDIRPRCPCAPCPEWKISNESTTRASGMDLLYIESIALQRCACDILVCNSSQIADGGHDGCDSPPSIHFVNCDVAM
jgi:hypothetical protein